MGKLCALLGNRRALSPIFATVLLASDSYYVWLCCLLLCYKPSLILQQTVIQVLCLRSQQAVGERIGFENIIYNSSSPARLTIYMINSGLANNIQIKHSISLRFES